MTYGTYEFSPVPFLSLSKEYTKSGDGTHIGTLWSVTLTGTLQLPAGTSGITALIALQDNLREAFSDEGKCLVLKCDETTLLQAAPRVTSISFSESNNNWVINMPYTITLEWDEEPSSGGEDGDLMPSYIQNVQCDWSVEFVEDQNYHSWTLDDGSNTVDTLPYVARITNNVNAVGKRHYTCDGSGSGATLVSSAWEQARNWVIDHLASQPTSTVVQNSGILNLDASLMGYYNHTRTVSIHELAGEVSVEQSWLVYPSGISGVPGSALESYTVEIQDTLDGTTSLSIQGSIRGLEERTYGSSPGNFSITASKYDNALSYWNVVKTRLYWRAKKTLEGSDTTYYNPLNSSALDTSMGHNMGEGSISYSYRYDTRPCNYISGARTENISISEDHPTDVINELIVPGRANGPILQEISTVSAGQRTVSIDVLMAPNSGDCSSQSTLFSSMLAMSTAPKTQVETLLCAYEGELTAAYGQVFKVTDTSNWEPKSARYTRNVTWRFTNCTGSAPATSFC